MSIAESKREKIGSIFNGNQFIIPSYQRKYSWSDKERKELWDDIKDARNNGIAHFFGTLIFKRICDDESLEEIYEIIDGQQRTTTLFILLNELIHKLKDGEKKDDYLSTYIQKRGQLKLKPLGADQDFLKKILCDFNSIDRTTIVKRSHRNLYEAKKFFSGVLSGYTEEELIQVINFIRSKIEVLVLVVQKQSEAIRMFEIINDRGLELSYLDKIKSILMLYSTMYLDDSLNNHINSSFETIFDSNDQIIVKKEELKILNRFDEKETLFSHHYIKCREYFPGTWNYRNGAKTIFEGIKNRCLNLKDNKDELNRFIKSYTEDFSIFSKSYALLIDSINFKPKYKEAFQFLELSATLYPLVVILYNQKKLDDLLDLLISIEVRVYKFKGTNPRADIPSLCNMLVREDWTISDVSEWLVWFKEKFMNDGNFKHLLNDSVYGNNAIKYILLKHNYNILQHDTTEVITVDNYSKLQVEHIFPSGGDDGVKFDVSSFGFDDNEDYDYTIGKLGNLTLLEKNLNAGKDVTDLTPSEKVSGYLKSNVPGTHSLAGKIDKNGFSKEQLEKRNKKIIQFCIKEF